LIRTFKSGRWLDEDFVRAGALWADRLCCTQSCSLPFAKYAKAWGTQNIHAAAEFKGWATRPRTRHGVEGALTLCAWVPESI